MHNMINFPHLGIYLNNVGKTISVFGFEIAYYGIIIGCAMLIGIFLASQEAKRTRQNPENYVDLGIIGIICGVIGARIYFVIFSWDMYKDDLLSIFYTRQGGLAIYGGIIAAVITVLVYAKVKKLSAPLIFDTVGPCILIGQMLGRWGNFFNREAFGGYTDSLLAMQLPLDAVRSSDVTAQMQENLVTLDGVDFIQVHPTFLYESVWCLILLIIILVYRRHKKYDGEIFLIYLFGYGLGRMWIEGLRTDQLLLPIVNLPVSQILAGIVVVVTGILLLYCRKNHKRMPYIKSEKKYDQGPAKPQGAKKPKASERIFKERR